MTLVNMETLLDKAKEGGYAVGAFNATDLNTARGIVEAAEELNSPIILQFAEGQSPYISMEMTANMYLDLARNANVPICIHLDHGESFETIVKAMNLGFTSVMIDASRKTIEENIRRTNKVIEIAKCLDISVEAELGIMNLEDGSGRINYQEMDASYTDPKEAERFVKETDVDALAVAFGTVHGLYKFKPKLNFELLREIKKKTNKPLVMHGGSGLTDKEYRKAIENGVVKINYYSTMAYEAANGLRDYLNKNHEAYLHDVNLEIIDLVRKNIKEKIKVFGSANKA